MRKPFHYFNIIRNGSFYFIIAMLLPLVNLQAQQDAFPGAEGYGRYATGGRGGDVYHVTNLSDFGAGSLRYGIQSANGPRTIVFDVAGNIFLTGRLRIEKPNITIAGQTAPGDGITLAGNSLYIYDSDIIVRYIRVRYGDQTSNDGDAVSIISGKHIILDHVTASWSIDETLSCQSEDVDSLTVQWCMVTESLRYSHHEKGAHGYGGIIGSERQSFHHNLYAHHSSRNPKITGRRHCEVDFRNNVIYNWGFNSCYDGTSSYINWATNYYKAGPATDNDVKKRIFRLSDADIEPGGSNNPEDSQNYETSLYAEGNYVHGYPDVTADNWAGGIDFTDGATEEKNRARTPFAFPALTEQSAEEAYPLVLAGAGASMVRDIIDKRIANEVLTGTTTYNGSVSGDPGIIDSQGDVGGWPTLNAGTPPSDTDQDGMSDAWETENGLNPNDPEDRNGDLNSDGYTNLEAYLHYLVTRYPVSVEEREKKQMQLSCYPNPAGAYFTIDLSSIGASCLEIYSSLGQCVYTRNTSESLYRIDDHKLSSGIYFVKVRDSRNVIYTQKLMIE